MWLFVLHSSSSSIYSVKQCHMYVYIVYEYKIELTNLYNLYMIHVKLYGILKNITSYSIV